MQSIALISEHASPLASAGGVDSGGQNIYVAHVARELAKRGWQVDVFTRRDNMLLPAIVNWTPGVRVIHVPAGPPTTLPKERLLPYMDDFARFLIAFFKQQRPGYRLVHGNFFMSGWAGLQAARSCGVPLVMTFHALGRVRRHHQGDADGFPDERLTIEERLLCEAERTVAECPCDRDDMLSLYHADPHRIDIVPCGVDPEELSPVEKRAAREQLRWPQDDFIVLQLGRLVPRKGVDNVIRAFGLARGELGPRARLYVVGGNSVRPNPAATPEMARLQQIARESGVADRVEFTGRRGRDTLRLYYSAADVFVTTPWYEPFGITPLEAMACATPVIGSDVGGIRYTVVDSVTGYRVPPRNPAALADRLLRLRRDPRLRHELGHAGRRRVMRSFTWRRVARELSGVYARAVGELRPVTAASLGAQG